MKKINLLLLIYASLFFGIFTAQAQSLSVSATVISNVSCYGGSNGNIIANPSGGTAPYTYLWLPSSQTTQIASGLAATMYTVEVTDHIGTTASTSATISQPAALSIGCTAKYSSVCPGSSDSLFASGTGGVAPYAYTWTAPFGDISCNTCQNTNAYPYGATYVVTALNDMNGCTASASVSIIVRPVPLVTIAGPLSPVISYSNDTLIALAAGASSYLWSNSATTSVIIVSPAVPTTYSITTTNIYGCYDTAHYTVSPNSSGNGKTSGTAIVVSPSTSVTTTSYSSGDSVVWFSFTAADSNNQIIATSAYLGIPVPHVHRLTLYDGSLNMLVDEHMPDITGANQIRIDISHLHPGSTYYVRAARCPAHRNMAGCNPSSSGECNASQRWDFQMCFRNVPVFVPNDSGAESPDFSQLYYEHRGQIADLNEIPRFDIKAYTNFASPAVFASDSALSFVFQHVDTAVSSADSTQRVDMVLTGTGVEPSQPVYKMQEDSGAGYLNYFLGYVPNGVTNVEGYSRLVYKNVYSNIDMQVYSNNVGIKLYFVCNPPSGGGAGGNPADIELQFKGASSVSVTGSGGLNVVTELGTLSFAPGYAYTDSAGIIKSKSWQPYFIAVNSNTVRFNTGAFNTNEPLVIRVDRGHSAPSVSNNLEWSTFYGSPGSTLLTDVSTDAPGNVYVTGFTNAMGFPTSNGAFRSGYNAATSNAVIVKFNNLDVSQWSTYYGGSVEDRGYSIVADSYGNVYVTGYTYSPDFPVNQPPVGTYTNCCYYGVINNGNPSCGEADAFIVMLNSAGTMKPMTNYVPWATYYGGCDGYGSGYGEIGDHLVLDGLHNLYLVGGHIAGIVKANLPLVTEGGAHNSDTGTGFILKFNVDVTNPTNFGKCEWATDIGGHNGSNPSSSALYGCTVDASNNFYVVGTVSESGYPILNPGADATFRGSADAGVVTKFSSTGNAIDWSTYYGSDSLYSASVKAITTDASGNAYITGSNGGNIPVVNPGWPYYSHPGWSSAYIGMFTPGGTLYWSTYFGGSGNISPTDIACDLNGDVVIVGAMDASCTLYAPSAPPGLYTPPVYPFSTNEIAFITAFNISKPTTLASWNTSNYMWGTPFGGYASQGAYGDAIDPISDQLYMVGHTTSPGNTQCPNTCPFPLYDGNGVPTFYGTNIGAGYPTSYGDGFISEFGLTPLIAASVNNVSDKQNEVKVYPNPASQDVTVQCSTEKSLDVEFVLYNLLGEPVYSEVVREPAGIIYKTIPVSSLSNGNYILQIIAGNNVYHAKITKLQ